MLGMKAVAAFDIMNKVHSSFPIFIIRILIPISAYRTELNPMHPSGDIHVAGIDNR